ncbi:MAG: ornithine carbamoyltransferase [Candidatus Sumerlaeota bacterium]|nr:ornithine carbamoyltransferase [Candidatus Sumerlaeota bacterium]
MRSLISIGDLSRADAEELLRIASVLKKELNEALAAGRRPKAHLDGKSLAMIFEKPSLRTRCSFEIGMFQLGGHAVSLQAAEIGRLGQRESIRDLARNLSRWVQIIQARVFSHAGVLELAREASVPVINGLSDFEHPTQIIADYLTILEARGSLDGLRLAWIGDSNNVAQSLMVMSSLFETKFTLAIPEGYDPPQEIWAVCEKANPKARDLISIVRSPKEAVKDADVLYTDTWVSMGQEEETEKRRKAFAGFQINDALLACAPSHAFVLHDMPAHRGEEITDSILDGDRCRAYEQAENRMHAIKAIMCWCLGAKV